MNEITIVIPCYNEAHSLYNLLDQIKSLKIKCNFLLIDNGSTDETASILKNSTLPKNVSYSTKKSNSGYGAGIKFGVKKVNTKLVGWMHGDLQQDLNVLSKIEKNLNILSKPGKKNLMAMKGLRTGRSIVENIFTIGVSITASILFFKKCWDIAVQPNLYRKRDLYFLDDAPDDHNFEFYVYLKFKMLGGQFFRFNAPFLKRRFGKSSWDNGILSKLVHSKNIFIYIFRLSFRRPHRR